MSSPGGADDRDSAPGRSAGRARGGPGPRIRMRSRHSRRSVPINRSANAFAFGALIGVLQTTRC
jgi:hypothetical protein